MKADDQVQRQGEVRAYIDASFSLEQTVQRYRERLQEGLDDSVRARFQADPGAAPQLPEYVQRVEAQVAQALEETLRRWKQREIKTEACIRDLAAYCPTRYWPRVFVAASSPGVAEVASLAAGMGYPIGAVPYGSGESPERFFEAFQLVPLQVPPLVELIEPLASLEGVAAVYDAERPVRLIVPDPDAVRAQLAESVPVIDPRGIRQRIGLEACGAGVRVCVCDTGIDETHPDLAGAVEAAMDFVGEGDGSDYCGHGTHVAGIIAGRGRASNGRYLGVAPGATLLSARVLDRTGNGTIFSVISGLQWALDHGADIINLSLGHDSDVTDGQSLESRVCNALVSKGVSVIVSAGNGGPDDGTLGVPADARDAITVGALSRQRTVCAFSSRGPTTAPDLTGPKPDLLAPGERVVSCRASKSNPSLWPPVAGAVRYARASGTSMAAPMVAGAAAVLLGLARRGGVTLTPLELKELLCSTCTPVPGARVEAQGAGLLNLSAAADTLRGGRESVPTESVENGGRRMDSAMQDDILSVDELAKYLKLKPVTLYKLLRQGKVPGFKVGGTWRFRRATIDEWIERRELEAGEEAMEEAPARPPAAFTIECGLCGMRLKSVPAHQCEAEDCGAPICDRCWNLRSRHHCKDHRSGIRGAEYRDTEQASVLSAMPVPGFAATAAPGLLEGLAPGAAPLSLISLLALESAFIERVRSQFAETQELPHPISAKPVPFRGTFEFLREQNEQSAILRHPRYAPEFARNLPLNRSLQYAVKVPKGVLGKKAVSVSVEAKFWFRWEDTFAKGDATRPRSAAELSERLMDAAKRGREQKQPIVLAIFSPSGWTPDAIEYVAPHENSPVAKFASPDVSVILLGPGPDACWLDPTDGRAAFCAPLVRGELPRDTLVRCLAALGAQMEGSRYVTLSAMTEALPFSETVIRAAMEQLVAESGDFVLETISGVGLTLRRREQV